MGFESDSPAGRVRTRVKQGTHSQGHTGTGSEPERETLLNFTTWGLYLSYPAPDSTCRVQILVQPLPS